jgi:hypothetical protein
MSGPEKKELKDVTIIKDQTMPEAGLNTQSLSLRCFEGISNRKQFRAFKLHS